LGLYAQCELEAGTRKIYFERVQLEGVATLGNVVAMSAAVLPSGWPGMEYSRAGIPYGYTHTHSQCQRDHIPTSASSSSSSSRHSYLLVGSGVGDQHEVALLRHALIAQLSWQSQPTVISRSRQSTSPSKN
jgi:hypothetical protein